MLVWGLSQITTAVGCAHLGRSHQEWLLRLEELIILIEEARSNGN